MPRGRPKGSGKSSDDKNSIVRVTLTFDLAKENHALVYRYLNDIQRGSKTDAVVTAILERANSHHDRQTQSENAQRSIESAVREEIDKSIPVIVEEVIKGIGQNIVVANVSTESVQVNDEKSDELDKKEAPLQPTAEAMLAAQMAEMFG